MVKAYGAMRIAQQIQGSHRGTAETSVNNYLYIICTSQPVLIR